MRTLLLLALFICLASPAIAGSLTTELRNFHAGHEKALRAASTNFGISQFSYRAIAKMDGFDKGKDAILLYKEVDFKRESSFEVIVNSDIDAIYAAYSFHF